MWASRVGDARLFGIGCGGSGAVWMPVRQALQAYLGRTWRSTRSLAGMNSSCSETSSPMRSSAVPSSAQTFFSSGRSWRISTRGIQSGSGLRPRFLRLCASTRMEASSSSPASSAVLSASLNRRICSSLLCSLFRPKRWCLSRRMYSRSVRSSPDNASTRDSFSSSSSDFM